LVRVAANSRLRVALAAALKVDWPFQSNLERPFALRQSPYGVAINNVHATTDRSSVCGWSITDRRLLLGRVTLRRRTRTESRSLTLREQRFLSVRFQSSLKSSGSCLPLFPCLDAQAGNFMRIKFRVPTSNWWSCAKWVPTIAIANNEVGPAFDRRLNR
jgi:hypothetical protein